VLVFTTKTRKPLRILRGFWVGQLTLDRTSPFERLG
jgi:hypothetical protein